MAKILVVEDEVELCDTMKEHLEEWGYDVVLAYDGVEALEKIENEEFDLISANWMMPRMTGIELCETLKQREKIKDIPMIMISGQDDRAQIAKAYDMGVDDYLTKPFRLTDLQVSISKALGRE